jgi:hypothetical protein
MVANECAPSHGVSGGTQDLCGSWLQGNEKGEWGGCQFLEPSSARPLPSGVTACGVLWVRPGDPMTRRPSSIVLI